MRWRLNLLKGVKVLVVSSKATSGDVTSSYYNFRDKQVCVNLFLRSVSVWGQTESRLIPSPRPQITQCPWRSDMDGMGMR